MQVIAASGATRRASPRDADERARIWKGRKGAFSAVGRLSPDFIVQDGVVPRSAAGRGAGGDRASCRAQHGIRVANVFHAGDGNLHPLILFDGREPGALERAEVLAGEILACASAWAARSPASTASASRSARSCREMYGADDIDAMRRLRPAMDPHEIANRGKMLPGGGDAGAARTACIRSSARA